MIGIPGNVTAVVVFLSVAAMSPALRGTQSAAMQTFSQRVNAYMEIRRAVAARVPAVPLSAEPKTIQAAADDLAKAIRAARVDAQLGDVFAPDLAEAFRTRVDSALRQRGYDAADLLREISSEAPSAPATLAVNGRFDWRYGAMTPPCIIEALPILPAGLEFRFVGRDLVLVDIDAGLIVDVLPRTLDGQRAAS